MQFGAKFPLHHAGENLVNKQININKRSCMHVGLAGRKALSCTGVAGPLDSADACC